MRLQSASNATSPSLPQDGPSGSRLKYGSRGSHASLTAVRNKAASMPCDEFRPDRTIVLPSRYDESISILSGMRSVAAWLSEMPLAGLSVAVLVSLAARTGTGLAAGKATRPPSTRAASEDQR